MNKTLTASKKRKRLRLSRVLLPAIGSLILFLGFACYFSGRWYVKTYGQLGFDSVLYTLLAEKGGTDPTIIKSYLLQGLFPALLSTVLFSLFLFFPCKRKIVLVLFRKLRLRLFPIKRFVAFFLCLILFAGLLSTAASDVQLTEYLEYIAQETHIYEEEYRDPATTSITFPEKKRNLIYIFLESMETSFFSTEQGGLHESCIIPELYTLAEENINFSTTENIGGFHMVHGTNWTVAAMVSQSAGIPLKTPPGIAGNGYGSDGPFLNATTSLMNVLHENGYYQALMVGSESSFGGRRQYYQQHNVDKIYDINTFWSDGIVEDGRYVWWGAEDHHLFSYAKQELTKIAAQDQPFAFTLLTVDTHFPDGFPCKYCDNVHDEQLENVYACSSRQTMEFIQWIQQQDFYEDTAIVIAGDHVSMDGAYFSRVNPKGKPRYVYNCFINSSVNTPNTKNRQFCAFDLFPTTLAAMGCEIEGNRLALGTNLFSGEPTLTEKMGISAFSTELSKSSTYYTSHFYFDDK